MTKDMAQEDVNDIFTTLSQHENEVKQLGAEKKMVKDSLALMSERKKGSSFKSSSSYKTKSRKSRALLTEVTDSSTDKSSTESEENSDEDMQRFAENLALLTKQFKSFEKNKYKPKYESYKKDKFKPRSEKKSFFQGLQVQAYKEFGILCLENFVAKKVEDGQNLMAEEENWLYKSSDDESAHFTQVCMMAKVDEDIGSSSDHSNCGSEVRIQSLKAQVKFMKEEFKTLKGKLSHERQTMLNFRDENSMLKDVVKEKEYEKDCLKKDKDVLNLKISELEGDLVNLNAEKGKVVNDDDTLSCTDSISSLKSVGFAYKDLNESYKTRKIEFSDFTSLFSPTESAKIDENNTESQCQFDESDLETDVENQVLLSDLFTSNSSNGSKDENIMNQNLNSDFSKIMTEEIFTEMMNASDPVPIIEKMESNSEVNQASNFETQITDLQKTIEELEDENVDLKFKLDKFFKENKELSRELNILKNDLFQQNLKEKKMFDSKNWNVHSNPEFDTVNSKTSVVYTTTPEYSPSIFEKGESSCTSKPRSFSSKKTNKILFSVSDVKRQNGKGERMKNVKENKVAKNKCNISDSCSLMCKNSNVSKCQSCMNDCTSLDKSKLLTFARKNFICKHCHDNAFIIPSIHPKFKVARKTSHVKSALNSLTHQTKNFHANIDHFSKKKTFHELNVKMVWKWVPKPRYEWRIKAKASHTGYIDSGCSRHMTGFKHLLHNYVEESAGTVSYANSEVTGYIRGHGSLTNGTVKIKKVLYVEGLDHNLFSTSQFCDSQFQVRFTDKCCYIEDKDGRAVFKAKRNANLYSVNFPTLSASRPVCLIAKASRAESWIWHRRLSHQNFDAMNQLARQGIVKGVPELRFEKNSLCPACEMGKMKRTSHKAKTKFSSSTPLELIHMDLCGPMRTQSINGKKYILVMIDEYSRYTWLEILRNKSDAAELIIEFLKKIQVRLQFPVISLRSDNGTEFKNEKLQSYLISVGISHNFSAAYTPQQNGVVERKNRTLVEAARTMLAYSELPMFLWAEAVATACVIFSMIETILVNLTRRLTKAISLVIR
ncbi:hypothetical protein L6452_06352 [Arctium lappa]|uniref:Uncharacterized protein n=1 Tax=Arctium lappa TaxID=4217 RepID=A0ACB9EJC8_ARCLA|nr:hypothetical protein L6452_06352 [Arctium lappa]